jgi:hypothetical protein
VRLNGVIAALYEIQPRDELESKLAQQMIATHHASLKCLRLASLDGQSFEARDMNLRYATKLTRIYVEQMEALNKKRGGGKQKMTVEHVHVYEGGQAIVGNVAQGQDKKGVRKNKHQSYARHYFDAPQPTVLRENPERTALSVAGNAQRPLPHAWWDQPRRTFRQTQRQLPSRDANQGGNRRKTAGVSVAEGMPGRLERTSGVIAAALSIWRAPTV